MGTVFDLLEFVRAWASSSERSVGKGEIGAAVDILGGLNEPRSLLL